MVRSIVPPPRIPPFDTSRPCAACRWCRQPGYFSRILLDAVAECHALPVRGLELDVVAGKSRLLPPRPCDFARNALGLCGPQGRYFEARDA